MLQYIPRPLHDIVVGPSFIKQNDQWHKKVEYAEKMIKAAGRIAILAVAALAYYKFGVSERIVGLAIGLTSLPCAFIVSSSVLMGIGVSKVVEAVATRSFMLVGSGLWRGICGLVHLRIHDIIQFGIGEIILSQVARRAAPSLVRAISS